MSEYIKEWLTIEDLQEEMKISYSKAAQIIRNINRKFNRNIPKRGRVHIKDYIDFYGLPIERYLKKGE